MYVYTQNITFLIQRNRSQPSVCAKKWLSVAFPWHRRPNRNRDAGRTSKSSPPVARYTGWWLNPNPLEKD